MLTELLQEQKNNYIDSLFPDTGPFRRELYPKHVKVFEHGANYRERAFIAGNRCITPWTAIETAHGSRRAIEVLFESSFDVRSWDGESRCDRPAGGVFLKGIEPAFRLHLDNGEFFDCSRKHRVLTDAGWLSLDQLIRASSGLRFYRTDLHSPANCAEGDRPYDAQPLSQSGSGQASLPEEGDAHTHGPSYSPVDAAERARRYSRACRQLDRSPILDDPDRLLALCAQFEDPESYIDALWSSDLRLELRRFAVEAYLRPVADLVGAHSLSLGGAFLAWRAIRCVYRIHIQNASQAPGVPLSLHASHPEQEDLLFAGDELGEWLFLPFNSPCLVGGQNIVSVTPLGFQPIIDFTVEDTHNYVAAGVIHHNCGKTLAGTYELACHLMGDYPHWWKGRRFDEPIDAWASGDTTETTRDILQLSLMGPPGMFGTGMIRQRCLDGAPSTRRGVADTIDTVRIKHKSGGISTCGFKSFDQGRKKFQGTAKHFILLDEEPPEDVYDECLMRLMTTNGLILLTFTPLEGLSTVALKFLPHMAPDTGEISASYRG